MFVLTLHVLKLVMVAESVKFARLWSLGQDA